MILSIGPFGHSISYHTPTLTIIVSATVTPWTTAVVKKWNGPLL